jgi:hypothetical protein
MRMYLRHKGKQYFLIDLLVFGKKLFLLLHCDPLFGPLELVSFLDGIQFLPLYTRWRAFVIRARTL